MIRRDCRSRSLQPANNRGRAPFSLAQSADLREQRSCSSNAGLRFADPPHRLLRRAHRSARLEGLDQVPVPAKFIMFLGVGKHAHEDQSREDTSGYQVLRHGCHSTGVSARLARPQLGMMNGFDAAVNAPQARRGIRCGVLAQTEKDRIAPSYWPLRRVRKS